MPFVNLDSDQVSLKLIAILYRKKLIDKALMDQAQARFGTKQDATWHEVLNKL